MLPRVFLYSSRCLRCSTRKKSWTRISKTVLGRFTKRAIGQSSRETIDTRKSRSPFRPRVPAVLVPPPSRGRNDLETKQHTRPDKRALIIVIVIHGSTRSASFSTRNRWRRSRHVIPKGAGRTAYMSGVSAEECLRGSTRLGGLEIEPLNVTPV